MGTHPIFESDFDCLTESPLREKQRKLRKGMDQRNILLNHQNYPAANYPMFAPVPGIDAPHVKYEQQVHAMGENTHTMHEQTISTVSTAQNDVCDEDLQIKKSASWSDWLKAIQKKVTPIFAYVDPRGLFKSKKPLLPT